VQNFLKIGSEVPELEDPEKWHFPLKAFIALTTVLRFGEDCDHLTARPENPLLGASILAIFCIQADLLPFCLKFRCHGNRCRSWWNLAV